MKLESLQATPWHQLQDYLYGHSIPSARRHCRGICHGGRHGGHHGAWCSYLEGFSVLVATATSRDEEMAKVGRQATRQMSVCRVFSEL